MDGLDGDTFGSMLAPPSTFRKAGAIIIKIIISVKTFGYFSLMYMCYEYCCCP
jgi:hypothetical protein